MALTTPFLFGVISRASMYKKWLRIGTSTILELKAQILDSYKLEENPGYVV